MKKTLIILPNQLFENIDDAYDTIIIYEHPHYFTKYKYHKSKLVYHRATMKTYFDFLIHRYESSKTKKKQKIIIKYVEYNENINDVYLKDEIYTYDPINHELMTEMKTKYKCKIIESKLFFLNNNDIADYKDKYFNTTFYIWMRKRFNILMTPAGKYIGGKLSFDKENRKPFPKSYIEPKINLQKTQAVEEATIYVNKHFAGNHGDINIFLPVSHADAKKYLDDFVKTKLKDFGSYEDAISDSVVIGHHSGFSALLNIGLLDVKMVIDEILKCVGKYPIASIEGFIRQIISWREYMRLIYAKEYDNYKDSNYLKHNNKIYKNEKNKKLIYNNRWFEGTMQIEPIDNVIKKVIKYSYCHHIERLMILSNFFLLCEIAPVDVSRWFMEMVSIDAYEWVMFGNIAMGIYSMRNLLTTRPYFSSSNYIFKMSNYKKSADSPILFDDYKWFDVWDALYYNFICNNKDMLKKNYSTAMMVRNYEKKTAAQKKEITNIAKKYISIYV